MFQFNMPENHPHKDAIMPMLRFLGWKPTIILQPHINGRLKVMRDNQWIGTVVPQFLDNGEEWGTGGKPYELLSVDNDHAYRGDAADMARILSMLQRFDGNWDEVANQS
jgi:hypothetical protein